MTASARANGAMRKGKAGGKMLTACAAVMLLFALAPEGAHAQKAMLPFARYDRNPVSAAMGGAGRLDTSEIAWSWRENTAAAAFSDGLAEVAASWQQRSPEHLEETFCSGGGAVRIDDRMVASAGFSMGRSGEYTVYDASGLSGGSFAPKNLEAGAGFGYRFTEHLSAGANVRYLSSELSPDVSYNAVSFDIMAMATAPLSGSTLLKWAAGVSTVGPEIRGSDGARYSLPSSTVAAAGIESGIGGRHKVTAEADADWYFKDGFAASLGASWTWADMVSVRAGYHYGGDTVVPSYLSAGLGVKWWKVRLDFAYMFPTGDYADLMKNSLCLGIGLAF